MVAMAGSLSSTLRLLPRLGELLRHEIALGDLHLLFLGVARDSTISMRSMSGPGMLSGSGRRNEQHFAQIDGTLR